MAERGSHPEAKPHPAGFLVRRLRQQACLTEAELAARAGVRLEIINRIECGRCGLSPRMAVLIGEVLHAPPADLLAAQLEHDLRVARRDLRSADHSELKGQRRSGPESARASS
jgi:transcriptional regulator with XRE-family HTH domain